MKENCWELKSFCLEMLEQELASDTNIIFYFNN